MTSGESWENFLGHRQFLKELEEINQADSRKAEEVRENEAIRIKSLQIGQDSRYRQMDYYRRQRLPKALEGWEEGFVKDKTYEEVCEKEVQEDLDIWTDERIVRKKVSSIEDRKDWQESMDRHVRQLLIDFDLTEVPPTRLGHLDRMHDWFVLHGCRQVRKVVEGPNYLLSPRDGPTVPGSTRQIPPPSAASLQLAGAYSMKHSSKKPSTAPASARR
mmetsp:Transcript_6822/g.15576  ORF Transcript_6822/g.15576 Transcript_6822/m.15576 type:complete len:217 (+) Transcript_6822:84-734(+)|eukprot:CAMPEP_0206476232 /NCGR_PEP_ID=MMETSP0324_2-20121206/34593_1 /ASSEMBLY_ACC=CAM_ASM_000836 /TAXON_ID=2866 /ORGANISM="Crypthecodinium cohnii, Strain Seligo" /LENGTH=216 /DNA_ID=CAMNT_0053951823 /DNA_START=137 /DNA_END=787 /DNA_ORIENTATION=+